jgi:hypothetical protein
MASTQLCCKRPKGKAAIRPNKIALTVSRFMARLAILTSSHKSTRKAAEKPDIQKGPPDFQKGPAASKRDQYRFYRYWPEPATRQSETGHSIVSIGTGKRGGGVRAFNASFTKDGGTQSAWRRQSKEAVSVFE